MNSLWDILSVAIGVSFVFMILSLLNSWVQEYIASIFSLRAGNLADILQNMLEPDADSLVGKKRAYTPFINGDNKDTGKKLEAKGFLSLFSKQKIANYTNNMIEQIKSRRITQHGEVMDDIPEKFKENPVRLFYEHPIIYSLSKPGVLPSYIPSNDFTVALFDLLNRAGREDGTNTAPASDEISITNIKRGIEKIDRPMLRARLRALMDSAQINKATSAIGLDDFRGAVTNWFDETVDRGRGWYKRTMQAIGIVCGLVIAFVLNADTVGLSVALWQNAVLRDSISQAAVVYAEKGDNLNAREAQQQLINLGLPIGWSFGFADHDPATPDDPRDFPVTAGGWIAKLIGLVMTGFAISQGSQIWFDLMNRLINLRSAGVGRDAEDKSSGAKDKP